MTAPHHASRVLAAADAVLVRSNIGGNPFFAALDGGAMSLDEFRRSQEQFYHAVAFFPRPMAALVSRIPDPARRLDILRNVVEEHGDFEPARFHEATFRQFLRSIGARADDRPAARAPVRAFNAAVSAACQLEAWEVGVGCLGAIESAFADLSARIGRAVVRRGWVAEGELTHYKLHAEIDVRHAAEFFAVVEDAWGDPQRRADVVDGLELGAYVFDRLYRDLV